MCKRLLSPKAHHELLLYEGLMALINVSSCVSEWAEEIIVMECGIESNEVRTLYQVITQDLFFEKNVQVKLAACELFANLSLTKKM